MDLRAPSAWAWSLVDAGGEPAHAACVAFGLDRQALLAVHGRTPGREACGLR